MRIKFIHRRVLLATDTDFIIVHKFFYPILFILYPNKHFTSTKNDNSVQYSKYN